MQLERLKIYKYFNIQTFLAIDGWNDGSWMRCPVPGIQVSSDIFWMAEFAACDIKVVRIKSPKVHLHILWFFVNYIGISNIHLWND